MWTSAGEAGPLFCPKGVILLHTPSGGEGMGHCSWPEGPTIPTASQGTPVVGGAPGEAAEASGPRCWRAAGVAQPHPSSCRMPGLRPSHHWKRASGDNRCWPLPHCSPHPLGVPTGSPEPASRPPSSAARTGCGCTSPLTATTGSVASAPSTKVGRGCRASLVGRRHEPWGLVLYSDYRRTCLSLILFSFADRGCHTRSSLRGPAARGGDGDASRSCPSPEPPPGFASQSSYYQGPSKSRALCWAPDDHCLI